MSKKTLRLILITILVYILIYKLYLSSFSELVNYIINPLIWIIGTIIIYYFYYNKKRSTNYANKSITRIVIIGALIYITIYYFLGIYIGFTKSPYSLSYSGIIINIFSILLVTFLKEFIRFILINSVDNHHKYTYYSCIFMAFLLSDINFLILTKSFTSVETIINLLFKEITPLVSINLFMMYLCTTESLLAAIIYRPIIILPTIIIHIIPKYPWIIDVLFNILFPLFIYLIIKYLKSKKEKNMPIRLIEEFEPKKWITTFVLVILIVCFGIGFFPIVPIAVVSKSMEPSIRVGDLVIIKKVNIEDIKVGDIVQYKLNDVTVIHRVIKIVNKDELELILKGDNNKNPDKLPVKKDQIIGKFIYKIPYLGYPTYLLKQILGNNNVEVETGK